MSKTRQRINSHEHQGYIDGKAGANPRRSRRDRYYLAYHRGWKRGRWAHDQIRLQKQSTPVINGYDDL